MPEEAIELLESEMRQSQCYMEYGSGGSTYLAASIPVPAVFSVESDPGWSKAVQSQVKKQESSTRFEMLHVDVGAKPKNWGTPENNDRVRDWPAYPLKIWSVMSEAGFSPDLVLIDGRFRVACFAASILYGKPGLTILFDDYVGRTPQYGAVETILKPAKTVSRMQVFVRPKRIDTPAVAKLLATYTVDFR
jgi:hypothetical protein